MSLSASQRAEIAEALLQAEKTGVPIESLSKKHDAMGLGDAYAIQVLNAAKVKSKRTGYKIGLTSLAAQKHFNVEHPDFGQLFSAMSVVEGGRLEMGKLIQPKIEGEIAFTMGKDLEGPGVGFSDAMAAIDSVQASLEIIDSRIANWQISAADTIADNGSSARYALSGKPVSLKGIRLEHLGMGLFFNDEVAITASGAAVMGNPIHALVFLVEELAKHSMKLRAGDVILSGSLGGMLPLKRGSHYACEIAKLGRVAVSVAP